MDLISRLFHGTGNLMRTPDMAMVVLTLMQYQNAANKANMFDLKHVDSRVNTISQIDLF